MTGKEVLFKTLRHEETERPAWVPMAGGHAGDPLPMKSIRTRTSSSSLCWKWKRCMRLMA